MCWTPLNKIFEHPQINFEYCDPNKLNPLNPTKKKKKKNLK